MSDLKTLREESAKVSLILANLRQQMLYVERDLAAFAEFSQSDQMRDLTSAASVALYNADFTAQRLSFRLESIHDSIRMI